MRLVVAGTPEAAVPTLRALAATDHEIVAVVTREDAPIGRKRVLTPSPVASAALELQLPVIRANRLDAEVTERILALEPDLGVVVAYGGLIREPLLHGPRHGWINLHFSELPRWRGAAPVQRAVLAGDATTGIAVFQLEAGLDTGPTYVNEAVPIHPFETSGALLARLSEEGTGAVLSTVDAIAEGTAIATEQSGESSHAAKLTAADGRIDWALPFAQVRARILGATPEPGAVTQWRGDRFKVLAIGPTDAPSKGPGEVWSDAGRVLVGTTDVALEMLRVQPAGKPAMAAQDWWRGLRTAAEQFETQETPA